MPAGTPLKVSSRVLACAHSSQTISTASPALSATRTPLRSTARLRAVQAENSWMACSQIRRAVLLHAIISFAYNSVILAFVLNLVFSAA